MGTFQGPACVCWGGIPAAIVLQAAEVLEVDPYRQLSQTLRVCSAILRRSSTGIVPGFACTGGGFYQARLIRKQKSIIPRIATTALRGTSAVSFPRPFVP